MFYQDFVDLDLRYQNRFVVSDRNLESFKIVIIAEQGIVVHNSDF